AERAEMDRHAATCTKCDRARVRVQRVSDTFPILRHKAPPELGWDSIRARVHWAVSKAKRATGEQPMAHRRWLPILVGAVAVAAGGLGVYWVKGSSVAPVVATHAPEPATPVTPVTPATPVIALVSRISGDVMIDGAHLDATATFKSPLGTGTVLATGDGRVDLQFGEASAFALGPHSTLELRSFDSDTIELVVDGAVDLEVAPRTKHQRFFVVAGDATVEVRGTRFAVKHDATGTLVSCQHGLVAVRANGATTTELAVGTARKAFVPAGHAITESRAVPLTAEELTTLAVTAPWATPGWNPDFAARTASLDVVAAAPCRAVRIDGIELGAAPFAMRATPGRHTIEAADSTGRFRRAGWVDVSANAPARFEAMPIESPAAAPPNGAVGSVSAIATRKRELTTGLDHARLHQCTRRLAKSGLTDTFVQIEITIDASGAVNVLNIIDTDLPSDTAQCVHDALADVHFAAGSAASWRQKLTL
ncbi:MAG TPA: FecR domain-containing protein, partial [Kofleriaceae bacterium]